MALDPAFAVTRKVKYAFRSFFDVRVESVTDMNKCIDDESANHPNQDEHLQKKGGNKRCFLLSVFASVILLFCVVLVALLLFGSRLIDTSRTTNILFRIKNFKIDAV